MSFVTKQNTSPVWMRAVTEESVTSEIIKSRIPAVSWRLINQEELPADRTFRDAWKDSGIHIYHDMEKCRAIHRDRLRQARTPLLEALDIEYQRADEQDDLKVKRELATRKQKLRDVTKNPSIDTAATPDELKAVWPLE